MDMVVMDMMGLVKGEYRKPREYVAFSCTFERKVIDIK